MTEWRKEYCSEKPAELQTIAPGLYIQRKEIERVEHEADETAGTEAYTGYECMSREISVSDYQMLLSSEEIDTTKAIDDYTIQLIEEGVL